MKNLLSNFNKAFENKIRLGIMSILVVNDRYDFNSFKEILGVTDGNLASHLKYLENKMYITYEKTFESRKPKTTYSATQEGKIAFKKHLKAIEELLK